MGGWKLEGNFRRTTVVIPAYNVENKIGSFVLLARKYIGPYGGPVVVVDCGSFDRTAAVAELAGARVLRQEGRAGKGHALKRGFEVAVKEGAELIVALDPEGKYSPVAVPQLLRPILQGNADFVFGVHTFGGTWKCILMLKRLRKAFFRGEDPEFGRYRPDPKSGFFAFRASEIDYFRYGTVWQEFEGGPVESGQNGRLGFFSFLNFFRFLNSSNPSNSPNFSGFSGFSGSSSFPGFSGFSNFLSLFGNTSGLLPFQGGFIRAPRGGDGLVGRFLNYMESGRSLFDFTFPGIFIGMRGLKLRFVFL